MLKLALALLAAVSLAFAQPDGPSPAPNADPTDTTQLRLNGKRFSFDNLPFKADTSAPTTDPVYRGPQSGYNNCTGRPSSQDAMCQTLIVNSIDDFCIFAPSEMSTIGSAEGEVVSYCTKPTHGSRVMPAGTLTGVQFIRTPSYVEVTGFITEANMNIDGADGGGELDSGGQDQRGNPIGGLAYSNSLPTTAGKETQSISWHLFVGNGVFCMKLCDPNGTNPQGICRHTLDKLGCAVNVPAAYTNGVFLDCDGDDQAPVAEGVTAIPASRNCKTHISTELYPVTSGIPTATDVASSTTTGAPSATTTTGGTSETHSGGAVSHSSATTSGSGSNSTGTPRDSADVRHVSVLGLLLGIAMAHLMWAGL